jgi:hypothetical protein
MTAVLGRVTAHVATTALDLVKKGQETRVRVFGSWRITATNLMGPRIVLGNLMGCPEFLREDRINLKIFIERAQGHFLSPCSRRGALCTKQAR